MACSIDLAPGAVMDVFRVSALAAVVTQQVAACAPATEVSELLDQIDGLTDDYSQVSRSGA